MAIKNGCLRYAVQMKELIVIQGATRAEAEKLLHQVAQQLNPEAQATVDQAGVEKAKKK